MTQQQAAVVLGATGMVGNLLTQRLLKDPAFSKVRALVRRPLSFRHPRLEEQVVDFENGNDIQSKLGTGDCIFSCIGTTKKQVQGDEAVYWKIDHDIPVNAATLGKAAGFHTFVLVSSVGANPATTQFYLQLKGIVERDIAAQNYRSTHIFRPSMILGRREEKRLGESVLQGTMKAASYLMFGAMQKFKAIQADDIAKAMITAARQQQPGKYVYEFGAIKKLAVNGTNHKVAGR